MVRHIECEQGSDEWISARLGIPTASRFATVCASGHTKGSWSKTRDEYMRKLAGERITGEQMYSYTNENHARGKEMEAEARDWYAMMQDVDVDPCGIFVDDALRAGASPDGLVGADGLVEIKTCFPHIILEAYRRGKFPPEHFLQCLGQLIVTGRDWCDIVMYWPKMRPYKYRLLRNDYRDKERTLLLNLEQFNKELDAMVRDYEAAR